MQDAKDAPKQATAGSGTGNRAPEGRLRITAELARRIERRFTGHPVLCAAGYNLRRSGLLKPSNPWRTNLNALLENALPTCPQCGSIARPNILMFNDWNWLDERTLRQRKRISDWLASVSRLVIIELGAGVVIPTVRRFGERGPGTFIRITPRDCQHPRKVALALGLGAMEGVMHIAEKLSDGDTSR